MAEPHCSICATAGYLTCDMCGCIIFEPADDGRDFEICQECLELLPTEGD